MLPKPKMTWVERFGLPSLGDMTKTEAGASIKLHTDYDDGTRAVIDGWLLQLCGHDVDIFNVVDTETDGLYWAQGHRPFMVGFGILDVDNFHWGLEQRSQETANILRDPRILKVGHNIKFDIHMLMSAGYEVVGPFMDTMILTQLYSTQMNSYALKRLAANLLGENTEEEAKLKAWLSDENRKRRKIAKEFDTPYVEATYKDVPLQILWPYLDRDLDYTTKLLYKVGPTVLKTCKEACQVEMDLIPVVVKMERRGMPIDTEYFKLQSVKGHLELAVLNKEAQELAGSTFDVESNKQLGDVLLNRLGLKCMGWTDKGNPKFDRETLPLYDHPVAKTVLEYRKVKKITGTYFDPLYEYGRQSNGLVHANFKQSGAMRTFRFSCSDPNLQNLPRKNKAVRRGFICRPGYVNYYLDYSQIEMRVFAHYANSARLIRILNTKGGDVHRDNAIELFGNEAICVCENPEKCKCSADPLRFVGKTINFGILYGMGPRSFREQLRKRLLEELEYMDRKPSQTVIDLANITESQTKILLHKHYAKNPEIRTFMKETERTIARDKRIVDVFGKPYHVPEREGYKGVNYLVQGTSAGILKRAMLRLDEEFDKPFYQTVYNGLILKPWMLGCVHDEIVLEVPWRRATAQTARLLRDRMEDRATFRLPITVDVAVSRSNWAEKEELEL